MDQCAGIMLGEAVQHLSKETSLETIYFVLFDEASLLTFTGTWEKLASQFEL